MYIKIKMEVNEVHKDKNVSMIRKRMFYSRIISH